MSDYLAGISRAHVVRVGSVCPGVTLGYEVKVFSFPFVAEMRLSAFCAICDLSVIAAFGLSPSLYSVQTKRLLRTVVSINKVFRFSSQQ